MKWFDACGVLSTILFPLLIENPTPIGWSTHNKWPKWFQFHEVSIILFVPLTFWIWSGPTSLKHPNWLEPPGPPWSQITKGTVWSDQLK